MSDQELRGEFENIVSEANEQVAKVIADAKSRIRQLQAQEIERGNGAADLLGNRALGDLPYVKGTARDTDPKWHDWF